LALYKKYYGELKDIHFTNWETNKATYNVKLMEWYGRFFWAYHGFESEYKMLFDNFTEINRLYLDGNFISFLMHQLGLIYENYVQLPDQAARDAADSIEIPLAITYWYLNSGKYDAYSTITYAFDTLHPVQNSQQVVKLAFFKKMLLKSYKQKDIFLLHAGLEEASDSYIKLYDPEYVKIFDKLDAYFNKVERDGYRVIALIKKIDALYAYYVNHNDE
jgi:hypothetical protein